MRHSFEAHSSSPNFTYTCGINGCPQTFTSFSAIKSHLGRKHRGVDLEAACTVSSGGRQNESDAVPESMDFTELQLEENSPDQSLRSVDRLEKSAALFLLSLKERYEITQSALDFAVLQVRQMVAYAVEDVKESVEASLFSHLQASGIQLDLPEISECFCAPDPFCNLQSEYMQTKYYKENFDLVVSYI